MRTIYAKLQKKYEFLCNQYPKPYPSFHMETKYYLYGMKITLLAIGKTDNGNLQHLIEDYEKRLSHYVSFQLEMIPDIKTIPKAFCQS